MADKRPRFPGWRHMTSAQRRNARMDAIFERARYLAKQREAALEPGETGEFDAIDLAEGGDGKVFFS